jgi:uncharacterized membrane protein (UPF0136 family)
MIARWHDFFLAVGGGAAALAGLVFVAISINLDAVVFDPTHRNRNRAVGTLAGFTAAFMICAFAIMADQSKQMVGIEWLVIAGVGAYIYVNGYVKAVKTGGSQEGLSLLRVIGGTICYAAQIIGSILLIAGDDIGLHVAAAAMVIFFAFTISGAWLLIVGAHQAKRSRGGAESGSQVMREQS